jgi:hypothetical protein
VNDKAHEFEDIFSSISDIPELVVPVETPLEGPSLPPPPPPVAPRTAAQAMTSLGSLPLSVRNQIAMLARTLYTLDQAITAGAVQELWPERATMLQFGFDSDGAYKAKAPSLIVIEEYLATEDYLDKMNELGIALTKEDEGLSSKMIAYLTLVTDITSPLNPNQKLKKIGASWADLQAWLKNDTFKRAWDKLGGDAVKAAIPMAEIALANKMASGDQKATEFGFLLTGHFDPAKNKQIDAQKLFGILLEIIDEKVKDPEERLAIGQALSIRGNKALEI